MWMKALMLFIVMSHTIGAFAQKDSNSVILHPTTVAEFKGGNERMNRYISTYLSYPKEAKEKFISGTVYVGFVVTKKGKIQHVNVERGIHPLLDAAAVQMVKKMPKWKPARLNGRKVASKALIPVPFRLR